VAEESADSAGWTVEGRVTARSDAKVVLRACTTCTCEHGNSLVRRRCRPMACTASAIHPKLRCEPARLAQISKWKHTARTVTRS
jgi:hypothetical protein